MSDIIKAGIADFAKYFAGKIVAALITKFGFSWLLGSPVVSFFIEKLLNFAFTWTEIGLSIAMSHIANAINSKEYQDAADKNEQVQADPNASKADKQKADDDKFAAFQNLVVIGAKS